MTNRDPELLKKLRNKIKSHNSLRNKKVETDNPDEFISQLNTNNISEIVKKINSNPKMKKKFKKIFNQFNNQNQNQNIQLGDIVNNIPNRDISEVISETDV